MRFAAVARVTEDRWIACSVLDDLEFGLMPGGELQVETTICHEIRQSRQPVIIDEVDADPAWCRHQTPRMYGFQSYISMPIILADGSFFGTLCAIDPRPARLNNPQVVGMFRLFAELIARNLEISRKLADAGAALAEERAVAKLREQFLAVLAHDLRGPLCGVKALAGLLQRNLPADETPTVVNLIEGSATRMIGLVDNLLDLARGRLGGGIRLQRDAREPVEAVLRATISEFGATHPSRAIETDFEIGGNVDCDRPRIAQLFYNLLSNALSYGAEDRPVRVRARTSGDAFELSVANSGEPIPAPVMQQLFQPFFRNALHTNREGLGIGLYIADEIAKAHGGTLSVSSSAEETLFTFRMPLVAPGGGTAAA